MISVVILLLFVLILLILAVASFVFWILMLIDCSKRRFSDDTQKALWILVMVLAGIVGAVIYFIVVKRAK